MTAEHVPEATAREALLKQIPLGRIGAADDVAEAVRVPGSAARPATSPVRWSASTADC